MKNIPKVRRDNELKRTMRTEGKVRQKPALNWMSKVGNFLVYDYFIPTDV